MAKLIAVYGSPGSGKTTVALKLAMSAYLQTKDESVVFLSPDLAAPSMALLFPNYHPDEICSLSTVLDNTEISSENILKNSVTVKTMKNFCCLGFKAGENKYSFPVPTAEKINTLFDVLGDSFDYVFVDCSSDEISKKALIKANKVIRVVSPDLKGMTWYSSNKHTDRTENEDRFNVVNITEKELFLPTEEVCAKLHSVAAVLPYSRAVRQQMLDGRMYERLNDKKYNKKMLSIVNKIL